MVKSCSAHFIFLQRIEKNIEKKRETTGTKNTNVLFFRPRIHTTTTAIASGLRIYGMSCFVIGIYFIFEINSPFFLNKGSMDKSSDYELGDSWFESWRGHCAFDLINFVSCGFLLSFQSLLRSYEDGDQIHALMVTDYASLHLLFKMFLNSYNTSYPSFNKI